MARNQGLTTQLSALVSEEMRARIDTLEATYPVSRGDVVREALAAGLPTVESVGVPLPGLALYPLTAQISVLVTEEMKARIDLLAGGGRGAGGRVVRRALEVGLTSVEARLEARFAMYVDTGTEA